MGGRGASFSWLYRTLVYFETRTFKQLNIYYAVSLAFWLFRYFTLELLYTFFDKFSFKFTRESMIDRARNRTTKEWIWWLWVVFSWVLW
ncbi:hypothetical protein DD587_32030 [Klebsiella pneumoniae]|nr:hypothetical protein DD587_32030 [Klebsiella pneumoniae]